MKPLLHILLDDSKSCGECGYEGNEKNAGEDYDSCVEQVKADGKSEEEAHAICTESVKKESVLKRAFQAGFQKEAQGTDNDSAIRTMPATQAPSRKVRALHQLGDVKSDIRNAQRANSDTLGDAVTEALPESAAWGGLGAGIGSLTPGKYDAITSGLIGIGAPIASKLIEHGVGVDE